MPGRGKFRDVQGLEPTESPHKRREPVGILKAQELQLPVRLGLRCNGKTFIERNSLSFGLKGRETLTLYGLSSVLVVGDAVENLFVFFVIVIE